MDSYDLLLIMLKIETMTRGTNSMPFLVFRPHHLRSTSGIICGSVSFAVQFGVITGLEIISGLGIISGVEIICARCCTLLSPTSLIEESRDYFGGETYGDPIFFGSGLGFVKRTQSDPGLVNPVRSGPGFVNTNFFRSLFK